jgi:hypothetical protein
VNCLQRRRIDGTFLPLDAPDRASAGEARKAQAWEAAAAACSACHSHVLKWTFSSGWPSAVDCELPWHSQDLVEAYDDFQGIQVPLGYAPIPGPFERELYYYALQHGNLPCLRVLLDAGCRSPWICAIAVWYENMVALNLAASRGCRCDSLASEVAAAMGRLDLLQIVHCIRVRGHGTWSGPQSSDLELKLFRQHIQRMYVLAAKDDCVERLEALLCSVPDSDASYAAARSAVEKGHVRCLEALQR